MQLRALLSAVAVAGLVSACDRDTIDATGPATEMYQAQLRGANERPAVTTNGTGVFNGVVTPGGFLVYTISWSGLSSASNNGHFHGPTTATSTTTAGVLIDLNAPTSGRTITHSSASGGAGSAAGSIDLKVALNANVSADSLKKLLNGGMYINIHTVNNPGGEILGMITRVP